MKNKLFTILDDSTEIYCHITQFEEIDVEACKKIGINPGYTIINSFYGSYVSTIAGYGYNPHHYYENKIITNQNGTINSIPMIIHYIKDIKYLPNKLDVSYTRNLFLKIEQGSLDLEDILETISSENRENLRKILFSTKFSSNLAIIDMLTNKIIYEAKSFGTIKTWIPTYLWIPLKPITLEETKMTKLSPFNIEIFDLSK